MLSQTYRIPPDALFVQRHPGGDERARTADLLRAREALSQLSYIPSDIGPALSQVGLSGLEPETFPLSEGCSNQLS